jgi:quercetin dioxygenase-like cupin family protein
MPYVDRHDALNAMSVDLDAEIARRGAAPWRVELVGDPAVRMVLLGFPPGFATVPHLHPHAVELFHVLAGCLGFRLDQEPERIVGPGTVLLARVGQLHGLRVVGDQPLVIAATVAPNQDLADEAIDQPGLWPDWPAEPALDLQTGR